MSFHFVLKRSGWGYDDLYEALKTGQKTSEWRDASDFWIRRLLTPPGRQGLQRAHELKNPSKPFFLIDFPDYQWKHRRARFVIGYTKSPMLVADVKAIVYRSRSDQFEIQIENVVEMNRQCVHLTEEKEN